MDITRPSVSEKITKIKKEETLSREEHLEVSQPSAFDQVLSVKNEKTARKFQIVRVKTDRSSSTDVKDGEDGLPQPANKKRRIGYIVGKYQICRDDSKFLHVVQERDQKCERGGCLFATQSRRIMSWLQRFRKATGQGNAKAQCTV